MSTGDTRERIPLAVWGSVSSKHQVYHRDAVIAAKRIARYNARSKHFEIVVQCCGAGQGVMGSFVNTCLELGVHVRGYALKDFAHEANPNLKSRIVKNIGIREQLIVKGAFGVLVLPGGGVGTRKEFYCELIERERRGDVYEVASERVLQPIVFANLRACYHGLLLDIGGMSEDGALRYELDHDIWFAPTSKSAVEMLICNLLHKRQKESSAA